jgi:hypothetical protein
MTMGEEKVIAKYQKNTDSPMLDLVANAIGEAFLRRSPVIIFSESDSSSRSPSVLSYTSNSPKEQVTVQIEQPSILELTTHPIDIAELIESS